MVVKKGGSLIYASIFFLILSSQAIFRDFFPRSVEIYIVNLFLSCIFILVRIIAATPDLVSVKYD